MAAFEQAAGSPFLGLKILLLHIQLRVQLGFIQAGVF